MNRIFEGTVNQPHSYTSWLTSVDQVVFKKRIPNFEPSCDSLASSCKIQLYSGKQGCTGLLFRLQWLNLESPLILNRLIPNSRLDFLDNLIRQLLHHRQSLNITADLLRP